MNWFEKFEKHFVTWFDHAICVFDDITKNIDPSVFDKYNIFENAGGDKDLNEVLMYLQKFAVLCIENTDAKNCLFTPKYAISPSDFYQLSYCVYHSTLTKEPVITHLVNVSTEIINSISDKAIIGLPLFEDGIQHEISEDEVFDILSRLPIEQVVNIISRLDIEQTVKSNLKKYILAKDIKGFVEFSVINELDFSGIANICASLGLIKSFRSQLNCIQPPIKDIGATDELFDDQITDYVVGNIPSVARMYDAMKEGEGATEQIYYSLSMDTYVNNLWKFIYILIILTKKVKHLCPNYSLVAERDRLVASNSIFKSADERYTISDIDSLPTFVLPTLEDFKKRFITELEIPLSNNTKKDVSSHFSSDNLWTESDIKHLYRLLTEQGLLSWDIPTCFSFLYRMTYQYKPDSDSVSQLLCPICWKGEKRELFALLYHFHKGDTRIWKKCRSFFCDTKGHEILISAGVKNTAERLTDRINRIISDKDFRR